MSRRGTQGRGGVAAAALLVAALMAPVASAQGTDGPTFLVDLHLGSPWSADVRAAARRGYQLADGTPQSMRGWYSSRWQSLEIGLMTQVSPRTGILWGMSTGEAGEKYVIAPGLSLGLIHQVPAGRRGVITLRAETRLGSGLRERTCTADYGEIGGVQQVNCRLAATPLPPEETLGYLMQRDGWDATTVSIGYQLSF